MRKPTKVIQAKRARSYRFEADMLAPLVENLDTLIQSKVAQYRILFEVQSATGVPDAVLAAFNDQEITRRKNLGLVPIVDAPDVAVITLLNQASAAMTTKELSRLTGLTAGYLSSVVLRRLQHQGYIQRVTRGHWQATYSFRPLAHHIIAVENKLSDWRTGLWQAQRQDADQTWLIVDNSIAHRITPHASLFEACKVGLATLQSDSNSLDVLIPAPKRTPNAVRRNLLIERAASLYLSGQVSGPMSPVFGRTLLATTGVDPRQPDAVAH